MNPATADIRWRNPGATDVRSEPIEEDHRAVEPPFKLPFIRIFTEPPEVAVDTEFDVKKQPAVRIFFEGAGEHFRLGKLDALADAVELIIDRFDVLRLTSSQSCSITAYAALRRPASTEKG